jgi:hypothetical protein
MKPVNYKQVFSRSLVTWTMFIPIAVLNGAFREAVYKPFTGELAAHQISTIIACIAFFTLVYFRLKNQVPDTPKVILYRIGVMWVGMTILFEFSLAGVTGAKWQQLFHDYNILKGRIWGLFLLIVLYTPVVLKTWLTVRKIKKLQLSK